MTRSREARRLCEVPGCVDTAEAVLASVHADPVSLCAEHVKPLRAAALDLFRRPRPEIAHA